MPARGEHDLVRYLTTGINLKATGQTLMVPVQPGRKFLPTAVYLQLTTVTAYAVTAAIVRLGNNGTFNNVAPLLTVVLTSTTDQIIAIPLNAIPSAIDIGSTGISLDVQTAGAATTLTATLHVVGILI